MTTTVRASHLLVKTEEEAIELKGKIKTEEDFAAAAKEVSLCPSGAEGGDLGYFSAGQMVKPFEDACFSMEIGEISEPIKTQFGWHLIILTGKN